MRLKRENRYELKFVIRCEQQKALFADLAAFLEPDENGDKSGAYTVTSLYYDTEDFKAYWDKLEGHRFRRKVRVRVYGEAPVTLQTPCYVEIKQRLNSILQKKRACLPYGNAVDFQRFARELDVPAADQQVLDEVYYLASTLKLQPTCVVRYTRRALNGNETYPDLRITFDSNLRCRSHALSLLDGEHGENKFFLDPHCGILEIKANYTIPYWLAQLISKYRCTPRRFSKYCTALEHSQGALYRHRITT
jgi:hypothetical protein